MALVPMEIVYGTVLLPDAPLSFLALASFACLVQTQEARDDKKWPWVLAAGFLLGLGYTCKVTALFLVLPAVAQVYFLRRGNWLVAIFAAAIGFVIAAENLVLWFVLVVDPDDCEGLAECLVEMHLDRALRKSCRDNMAQMRDQFSVEAQAGKWRDMAWGLSEANAGKNVAESLSFSGEISGQ